MKIVIVMTFYDRQAQLTKTLASISPCEVIVVDDCSPTPPVCDCQVLKTENKRWIDGSPAYNIGIKEALKTADVIVLQNAECYHVGDIVKYAEKVTDKNYISFGCYNLSKEWTFRDHDLSWIIHNFNGTAVDNEQNAWLNNSRRPMGYHWCSAISAGNMRKLNGFDERFSEGYCFEDDEFLARVKMLGLKVEIVDYPFVVHQWHDRSYVPKNWNELYNINGSMLQKIISEGSYVARHKFTDDFNN